LKTPLPKTAFAGMQMPVSFVRASDYAAPLILGGCTTNHMLQTNEYKPTEQTNLTSTFFNASSICCNNCVFLYRYRGARLLR
jgi:hypothetical protein